MSKAICCRFLMDSMSSNPRNHNGLQQLGAICSEKLRSRESRAMQLGLEMEGLEVQGSLLTFIANVG